MKNWVRPLDQVSVSDGVRYGGKASVLGSLNKEGLRISPGLCIDRNVFDEFIEKDSEASHVMSRMKLLSPEDESGWKAAYQEMHSALGKPTCYAWIQRLVEETQLKLFLRENSTLVVRSSGIAEDSRSASFAGLYESVLNVKTPEDLVEAILKSWRSAYDVSVLEYIFARGQLGRAAEFSVLVQRQVLATCSGVAFTMDPMTGHDHYLLIQASTQGTEAVTSGADGGIQINLSYSYDSHTKSWKIISDPDELDKLNRCGLQALPEVLLQVRRLFGRPQDVEWALENSEIVLLQSRPITTLPREFLAKTGQEHVLQKTRLGREIFPGVYTPLAGSLILDCFSKVEEAFFRDFLGCPYLTSNWKLVNGYFYIDKSQRLAYSPQGAYMSYRKPWYKRRDWLLEIDWRLKFSRARHLIRSYFKPGLERFDSVLRESSSSKLENLWSSLEDLRQFIVQAMLFNQCYTNLYERKFGLVQDQISKEIGSYFSRQQLFRLVTSELHAKSMVGSLNELALFVRNHPQLLELLTVATSVATPVAATGTTARATKGSAVEELKKSTLKESREFNQLLEDFFAEYGLHASIDSNIYIPSLKEDGAESILSTIVAMSSVERHSQTNLASMAQTGPVLSEHQRKLIVKLSALCEIREQARTSWTKSLRMCRPLILNMAKIFRDKGHVREVNDIFFLRLEELDRMIHSPGIKPGDFFDIIEARKSIFEDQSNLSSPEEFLSSFAFTSAKTEVNSVVAGDVKTLVGSSACAGKVTAPVFLMRDPNRDQPPENPKDYIFVLPYLDRGAWPWLLVAKGLIIDKGGILSHGAILAREMGIPTVVGTQFAFQVLKGGELVTLDAIQGRVVVAKAEDEVKAATPPLKLVN